MEKGEGVIYNHQAPPLSNRNQFQRPGDAFLCCDLHLCLISIATD